MPGYEDQGGASRFFYVAKAGFEPVVLARKPLAGTVAANVLTHGTGALNIDGCRIGSTVATCDAPSRGREHPRQRGGRASWLQTAVQATQPSGRWPANVILDEDMAGVLDEQSGVQRDGVAVNRNRDGNDKASWYGTPIKQAGPDVGYGGQGGASRFFYFAKAPKRERPAVDGTAHPTVKPLALMRWLVRLVTPPGGTVLEPFAGSGATVEACIIEGFHCIAIEREAEYLPLIRHRIDRNQATEPDDATDDELSLFDI